MRRREGREVEVSVCLCVRAKARGRGGGGGGECAQGRKGGEQTHKEGWSMGVGGGAVCAMCGRRSKTFNSSLSPSLSPSPTHPLPTHSLTHSLTHTHVGQADKVRAVDTPKGRTRGDKGKGGMQTGPVQSLLYRHNCLRLRDFEVISVKSHFRDAFLQRLVVFHVPRGDRCRIYRFSS